MGETLTDILALLELEAVGPDSFDGPQPDGANNVRIFGGQVAAQALMAAGLTAPNRAVHSLHLYFLRMGDPQAPLRYTVTTLRDGRTFSARAVQVTQGDDRVILEALASFTEPVGVIDYQQSMPDVPAPEDLPPMDIHLAAYAEHMGGYWVQPRAVDMRYVEPHPLAAADQPDAPGALSRVWLRANGEVPCDPLTANALLAYISDWTILDPVLYVTRRKPEPGSIASLDHAMWFHRPPDFSDWLLYEECSPSGVGARGLSNGTIYNRAGQLVCTVVQEGYLGRG
ncbi:MAG: acyl-CoA thioesterase [Mycobacterium sp.]|nr:acyl-CoA thioesterase [Mycobacterium sp.]